MNPQTDIDLDTLKAEPHFQITKINNCIYLGSFEHPVLLTDEFKDLGINVVINCASEIKYTLDSPYISENYPIDINDSNSFLEYMDAIAGSIAKHIRSGRKIYLHCYHGTSRSPAALAYYMMMHRQLTYNKAVKIISKNRSVVEIDFDLENSLRVLEEE